MKSDDKLVQCMECHCYGKLRCKEGKAILVPQFSKAVRFYDEVGSFGLKPHGFATEKQKHSVVALGTLFWMTIILAVNYAGLQELRTEYTYKTLNCGRNFKQCLLEFPYKGCYSSFSICMKENTVFVFPEKMDVIEKNETISTDHFTEKEQNVNLKRCKRLNFYDLRVCQDFCSKTHENDNLICIKLCKQLMSDQGESKDICPFEKRCPLGCPCKFFVCEHVDHKKFPLVWYHNETDPMFELKRGHQEIFFPDYVWDFEPANKMRRHFSRMALFNLQERKNLFVYERIVFLRANTDTMLSSLKYLQREIEEYVQFLAFGSTYAMGSLYFQGKNYLFDGRLNVYVMESDSGEVTDLDVDNDLFRSRYGTTALFFFDGSGSVLVVHEDLFYFCSTYKYQDYCFYLNPLQSGRKKIYEAKGRLAGSFSPNRKNAFVSNNQLHIIEVDIMSVAVRLHSMQHRDKDWSIIIYEDNSWERDFRNDSFNCDAFSMTSGACYGPDNFPFETELQDFYPLPDRKGVLFIATFRRREFFIEKRPCLYYLPCSPGSFVDERVYTKAEYFVYIYRYIYGRFVKIGQMDTNFRYGDQEYGFSLSTPFYKDISAFEDNGDIIVAANSEQKPFRLVLDFEDDQNYLEEFELPDGIEFMTAFF